MSNPLERFEIIVRRANRYTERRSEPAGGYHPFDERNIHPSLPQVVKDLFDDGHFSQSTFEAYKYLDKKIRKHSKIRESGFKLMMRALASESPIIQLNNLSSTSEVDEQKGYQFIFAGSMLAIRNPRGHENLIDTPDKCLDHLSLASLLLRRLEESGYK